jgi:hypothetical protein
MSDKVPLTIDLTLEEHQQIEEMAQRHGYDTPADFLHALVSTVIAEQEEYDFDTKEGILAGLRESWHQAMTGNTRPVSELWDALDADE